MKKSIKYAGVAAATLLAVAPVAAPVLSNTTTVNAALTADQTAAATKTVNDNATSWLNSLADQTAAALPDLSDQATFKPGVNGADGTIETTVSAFAVTNLYSANNGGPAVTTLLADGTKANLTLSIKGVSSKNDYNNLAKNQDTYVITYTISSYVDADGNTVKLDTPVTKTVTYSKTATTTPDVNKTAAITYTGSKDVAYNSSVDDVLYANTSDFAVKDANGKDIPSFTAEPGVIYDSYAAAVKGTGSDTDLVAGKNFGTADKTYYQVVTVTPTAGSDFATFLTSYNDTAAEAKAAGVNADGSYKLTINGSTPSSTDATVSASSVTYIRAINVGSKEDAAWTVKDESGVVTTKNDKTYYTLKNDDNKTISNRALAANTSWQYDKTRTNANGDVQYRVSTHEWVPAESVNVNDGNNNGGSETPEGALTVTNLDSKKVVNLATPGMTYFVYNKDGVMSTTRALAGGSSWLVDKTAVDAAGNTYYGVSTDEFVKAGEGVSLAD